MTEVLINKMEAMENKVIKKTTRTTSYNIKLTKQELSFLRHVVNFYGEECYNMDKEDSTLHSKITKKLN